MQFHSVDCFDFFPWRTFPRIFRDGRLWKNSVGTGG